MADENIDPELFHRNKDAGALNWGCWHFLPNSQVGCYSIDEFDGIPYGKYTKYRHFAMCYHGSKSKCVVTTKEARILASKPMIYCDKCLELAKMKLDSHLKSAKRLRAWIEEADGLRNKWLKIRPPPSNVRPATIMRCPACKRNVPYDWEVCEEDRGGCGTRRDGQQFRGGDNTVVGEGDMSTDEEQRRRWGVYPEDDLE